MLPSFNRLPKQNIQYIMRRGARATSVELDLRYIKTNKTPRFAFIVSTKMDKRATQRNRIRRIVSESVRHIVPSIAGIDCVFVVHKNITKESQQHAEKLTAELLRRAKLL